MIVIRREETKDKNNYTRSVHWAIPTKALFANIKLWFNPDTGLGAEPQGSYIGDYSADIAFGADAEYRFTYAQAFSNPPAGDSTERESSFRGAGNGNISRMLTFDNLFSAAQINFKPVVP